MHLSAKFYKNFAVIAQLSFCEEHREGHY